MEIKLLTLRNSNGVGRFDSTSCTRILGLKLVVLTLIPENIPMINYGIQSVTKTGLNLQFLD